MYDFGGRECPHCGKLIQVFRGRFRFHGPRGFPCPGSGEVFEAIEHSVQSDECQSHAWRVKTTAFKFCPDCGKPLGTRR